MDTLPVLSAIEELKKELKSEIAELKESTDFCSKSVDEFKTALNELKSFKAQLGQLNAANEQLRSENKELRSSLENSVNRIAELEQYSRLKNLEIKGVPVNTNENVQDVIKQITETLSVPLEMQDVDVCHRVPTKQPSQQHIVVQFTTRQKRDAVLYAAKKKRLTTGMIGIPGQTSPIFVNEHLTLSNKLLLSETIKAKKGKSWKFVWTKNGKVYARKTENSRVVNIQNMSDIEKIV